MKTAEKITIAIADDHKLFRSGIAAFLKNIDEVELIYEAEDGKELVDKVKMQQPEIILMDLNMPVMNGTEAIRKIKDLYPDVKIIALTMYDNEKMITNVLEIGASGYLLKDVEPEELKNAIFSTHETGYYFNDFVNSTLLKQLLRNKKLDPKFKKSFELSDREIEVLKLICKELTNAEIAELLSLSPRTVDGHRQRLLEKTGAKNTAGLVMYAFRKGYVS